MKQREKRIAFKNLPRGLSLDFFATIWLLLDRFKFGDSSFAVLYCVFVLNSIGVIIQRFESESVDIFEDNKTNK